MSKLEKGYIQIYTGDGKGKTTAALGLGMRAAGNGLKVYMVQFLKSSMTGELNSVKMLQPNFKIFRFEKERNFFWNLNEQEKLELKNEILEAYNFCLKALKNNECDILIMDEIMGVLKNKLIEEEQLLELINIKPVDVELVLTGRNVPVKIQEKADLITEMKAVKHYYTEGVASREGIEF